VLPKGSLIIDAFPLSIDNNKLLKNNYLFYLLFNEWEENTFT